VSLEVTVPTWGEERVAPEPAVFIASPEFNPLDAVDYGVLGTREPYVTTSGVESLACCHGYVFPN
jgi:hypothetical protein